MPDTAPAPSAISSQAQSGACQPATPPWCEQAPGRPTLSLSVPSLHRPMLPEPLPKSSVVGAPVSGSAGSEDGGSEDGGVEVGVSVVVLVVARASCSSSSRW